MSSVVSFFYPISRDAAFALHSKLAEEVKNQQTPKRHVIKNKVGRPPKRKLDTTHTESTDPVSNSSPCLSQDDSKKYINWWQPHLISKIEHAVNKKPRSFVDALAYLKATHDDGTFDKLSYENLRRWFHPKTLKLQPQYAIRKSDNEQRWVPLKQARTENSGSKSPVSDTAKDEIAKILKGMRESSVILNPFVMAPIMRGIIQQHQPEILEERGGTFKVSNSWIRRFVWKRFKWRYKCGTQATYKRPETWKQDIQEMIMRAALLVDKYKIPYEMFINFDQTGIHLVPNSGQRTYEEKGSRQVDIAGSDDKRQITAVITSTAAGDLLPIQLIFKGTTDRSKPSPLASKSALAAGFHITNSKNHWSNFNTMREFIENIISPYIDRTRDQLGLPDDSKAVLLMDCWSVHRGQQFREYLSKYHPHLIPLYVPAGCTGDAQPADLTIQRQIKVSFKKSFQTWLTGVVFDQLNNGVAPEKTKLDFSMPLLREKIPGWMLAAHEHVTQNTNTVLAGWAQSGILKAWEEDQQHAALRHHAHVSPLFDKKHSYPVPDIDEPQITRHIDDDDDDDDDEYDDMSDTDEDVDPEHQQEYIMQDEKELASTLASIAITREKRTVKHTVRFDNS